MDQKLRQACDTCHLRKIRCVSTGSGACAFCKGNRTSCTFSPRDTMGRPRKSSTETQRRRSRSKHSSRNSNSPETRGCSPFPDIQHENANGLLAANTTSGQSGVYCSFSKETSGCDQYVTAQSLEPRTNNTYRYASATIPTSTTLNGIPQTTLNYSLQDGVSDVNFPFTDTYTNGMLSIPDPLQQGQVLGNNAWTSFPNSPNHAWDADLENMLAMSRSTETTMHSPSDHAVYALLAQTIFILRPASLPEWTLDTADEAPRAEVFHRISELCGIMQQRLVLEIDPRDAGTLAMLACAAAGLVRDTYRDMLRGCRIALRASGNATDSAIEPVWGACTTIHSHGPQLRLMLQVFHHQDGLQQIMAGCGDLLMDLQCLQNEAQHILGLLGGYGA